MILDNTNNFDSKEGPLVSVIVPTKNSERTIERCLKSIKEQSYKNIELIVVDNYSEDKTFEIANKYADKIIKKGPERSLQRNYGAKISSVKYCYFIFSHNYIVIESY